MAILGENYSTLMQVDFSFCYTTSLFPSPFKIIFLPAHFSQPWYLIISSHPLPSFSRHALQLATGNMRHQPRTGNRAGAHERARESLQHGSRAG